MGKARGSIQIAGYIGVANAGETGERSLSTVIDELETKSGTITAPAGGVIPTTVPLGLSPGVTEALFLHVYSPRTVELRLDSSLTPVAGLAVLCKGHFVMTFAPGGGITALAVVNADSIEDATVSYTVGAKRNASDEDPSYWRETSV